MLWGLPGAWELTAREQFVLSPQSPGEVGAVSDWLEGMEAPRI